MPSMWAAWQQRWSRWMDARAPRSDELVLTQRNVYIIPSRGGWVFAGAAMILLLAAINEQLNLAYALAFLLGGVGIAAMSSTHANLRGLKLSLGPITRAHAGQAVHVNVRVTAHAGHQRGRPGLLWEGNHHSEVPPGQTGELMLNVPTQHRGWMHLPRWRVETTYPLGLFRAWSYWRAASPLLVWPALESSPPELPHAPATAGDGEHNPTPSRDEAHDLRPWRRGDALRDVVWRKSATRLASGQLPITREGAHKHRPSVRWIDWESTAGMGTEARLSRLAAWLVMAEKQAQQSGAPYGLRLPGVQSEPQVGTAHLHRCLDELAQWGQHKPDHGKPGGEA